MELPDELKHVGLETLHPEELLNTVPRLSAMRDSGGLHRAWEGVRVGLRPGPWTLRDDPAHLHSVQASR